MEGLLERSSLNYYNQDLVAKAGIATLYDVAKNTEDKEAFGKLFHTREILLNKNPHNALLKNAMDFFLFNLSLPSLKSQTKQKYIEIIKLLDNTNKEISKTGAQKIKPGSTVFVHSLNNHLVGVLVEASRHKKMTVNVLEHQPQGTGKKLSKFLKQHKIKVNIFSDLSINDAIYEADICLIGADAILKNKGFLGKKGSLLVSDLSKKHHIKTYAIAHTWKYDSKNNLLSDENIKDSSKKYDQVPKKNIEAYVCEHGIFKPDFIIEEILFFNKILR